MTKKELIDSVASQIGMGVAETTKIVEAFIGAIKTNVMAGKPIFIRGFGSFELKTKAARKGRNPKTNEEVFIPERKQAVFKVSKNFGDL